MTWILSADPGKATGLSLGHFTRELPYELHGYWEVLNGLTGFIKWWKEIGNSLTVDIIVSERFTLSSGNEFSADLEPVRIEGALEALCATLSRPIVWQERSAKAGVKDAQMRSGGFWVASVPNHTDARDVNDATKHALEYLRRSMHVPTIKVLTQYE